MIISNDRHGFKTFNLVSNSSCYLYVTLISRFILYTKKNPTDGQILNVNVNKTILKSNFSPRRPTKMIIHGFIDTPLSNWVSCVYLVMG